ncbi:MAG: hypothetical protein BYD32DRAFT_145881 [Podila humilis]|nr:MAG: hypothetical protein BYD32DRAFT_145881 [Podila humilis]
MPCESCPFFGAYSPQDKPEHTSHTLHHHHHQNCPLSTSPILAPRLPLPLPSSSSSLCNFLWNLLSDKCSCHHTPSIPNHTSPRTSRSWPRSRLFNSVLSVSSRRKTKKTRTLRNESNTLPLRLLATETSPLLHLASPTRRHTTSPFARDRLLSIDTPSLPSSSSTSTYSPLPPPFPPLENDVNLCDLEKEIEATDRPPWTLCPQRNNPHTTNISKMYSSSLHQIWVLLVLLVLVLSFLLTADAAPTFALPTTRTPLLLGVDKSNTVAMNLSSLPTCDPNTMTGTDGRRSEVYKDGRIRIAAVNHGTGKVPHNSFTLLLAIIFNTINCVVLCYDRHYSYLGSHPFRCSRCRQACRRGSDMDLANKRSV